MKRKAHHIMLDWAQAMERVARYKDACGRNWLTPEARKELRASARRLRKQYRNA